MSPDATTLKYDFTGVRGPEYDRIKTLARFLAKVQITKTCWLWIGGLFVSPRGGYGEFWHNGKVRRAHRFSYEFFVGPIEPGKLVLHKEECNNRRCVNPNHLYLGTHIDNVRDRLKWGRSNSGEQNPNAKLSKDDVIAIRKIHEDKGRRYETTAKLFNTTTPNVSRIVRRITWRGRALL